MLQKKIRVPIMRNKFMNNKSTDCTYDYSYRNRSQSSQIDSIKPINERYIQKHTSSDNVSVNSNNEQLSEKSDNENTKLDNIMPAVQKLNLMNIQDFNRNSYQEQIIKIIKDEIHSVLQKTQKEQINRKFENLVISNQSLLILNSVKENNQHFQIILLVVFPFQ